MNMNSDHAAESNERSCSDSVARVDPVSGVSNLKIQARLNIENLLRAPCKFQYSQRSEFPDCKYHAVPYIFRKITGKAATGTLDIMHD